MSPELTTAPGVAYPVLTMQTTSVLLWWGWRRERDGSVG